MLIVFKHRWNVTGRIKATLAKNVYTVYVIQIPIILFWQSRFIQGGVLIPGGCCSQWLGFTCFRHISSAYHIRVAVISLGLI